MMSTFIRIDKLWMLVCSLSLYQSMPAFCQQMDELQSPPASSKRAIMILEPADLDVTMIVNDRPVFYKPLPAEFENLEKVLTEQVESARKMMSTEPLELAIALENLGAFYYRQGQYVDSRKCFEEALQLDSKNPEISEHDMAATQDNLALSCRALGKYDEAIELYQKSLQCRWLKLGGRNREVATNLSKLAATYYDKGDSKRCADLERQSRDCLDTAQRAVGRVPELSIFGGRLRGTQQLMVSSGQARDRQQIAESKRKAEAEAMEIALGNKRPTSQIEKLRQRRRRVQPYFGLSNETAATPTKFTIVDFIQMPSHLTGNESHAELTGELQDLYYSKLRGLADRYPPASNSELIRIVASGGTILEVLGGRRALIASSNFLNEIDWGRATTFEIEATSGLYLQIENTSSRKKIEVRILGIW